MKIRIKKLEIVCKRDTVTIEFNRITHIWGPAGVGKSTIARLIDYCLGEEKLIETPAIQKEFISAKLELLIEHFEIVLERPLRHNQILVTYNQDYSNNWRNLLVSIKAGKKIFPNMALENISDLLFYFGGNTNPPKIKRSMYADDSPLIRLSFRDLMWYCYLDQSIIDSQFFYLYKDEDYFKHPKSRDIMRILTGYYNIEIIELEGELSQTIYERKNLMDAAKKIEEIFRQTNLKSKFNILSKINNFEKQIQLLDQQISNKETIRKNNEHPIDILRKKSLYLSIDLEDLKKEINFCTTKIKNQENTLNEFYSQSLRISHLGAAHSIFEEVKFENCPQCGMEIKNRNVETNQCDLCTQNIVNQELTENNIQLIDMENRINEIKQYIEKMKEYRNELDKNLIDIKKEKEQIDQEIDLIEKEYNSKYLQYYLNFERDKNYLRGRVKELEEILELFARLDDYYKKIEELRNQEQKLSTLLDQSRRKVEQSDLNLEKFKKYFKDNLIRSHFPDLGEDDMIEISYPDFIPYISNSFKNYKVDFHSLGSHGKKTIFKACFALAVHRLAIELKEALLPSMLIIDTAMKNFSEVRDAKIFEGFYTLVYELAFDELTDYQIILIDSEFYQPPKYKESNEIKEIHMERDNPKYPRLIRYYEGM
jgi:energy-coupling factor transporter ATP-binding protein EcfA2